MELLNVRLRDWAAQVVGPDVRIGSEFPHSSDKGSRVVFFLHDLLPAPPVHCNKVAPLQVTLRYLVATFADSVEAAHNLLEKLVFAAMESQEFELSLLPSDPHVWLALGVPARPSFWLSVVHGKDRDAKPAPSVSEAVEVRIAPASTFHGRVLSVGNRRPLAGAKVELPGASLSTMTGTDGSFCFPAVPSHPNKQDVVVTYKQHVCRASMSMLHIPVEILISNKEL